MENLQELVKEVELELIGLHFLDGSKVKVGMVSNDRVIMLFKVINDKDYLKFEKDYASFQESLLQMGYANTKTKIDSLNEMYSGYTHSHRLSIVSENLKPTEREEQIKRVLVDLRKYLEQYKHKNRKNYQLPCKRKSHLGQNCEKFIS